MNVDISSQISDYRKHGSEVLNPLGRGKGRGKGAREGRKRRHKNLRFFVSSIPRLSIFKKRIFSCLLLLPSLAPLPRSLHRSRPAPSISSTPSLRQGHGGLQRVKAAPRQRNGWAPRHEALPFFDSRVSGN